ncbi:MAG: helicase HerA domain-containing protein [Myxococcota bacterium]
MTNLELLKEAFLAPDADDLFVSVAAFSEARELAELDVAHGHAAGRRALETIMVNASRRRASEGTRVALIRGAAGAGKTHLVAASLRKAAVDPSQSVLPAVLQLTAPVKIEDYERWLLDAVFRELSARHFPDEAGHSPLRRLADRLLSRVSDADRDHFLDFIDNLDDDGEVPMALDLGKRILRSARDLMQDSPPPAAFIGAILLAGYGDESAVHYLRRGRVDDRIEVLGISEPRDAQDRIEVLCFLGLTAELAGCTLALVFDQVENVVRLGNEALFRHTLIQGLRIAHDVRSAAVAFVALQSAYDSIAANELAQSERDRIEREAPAAVVLQNLSPDVLRDILVRRMEVLRKRRGLPTADGSLEPLPPEIVERALQQDSARRALLTVGSFRTRVHNEGWETTLPPPPPPPGDWDKEWADFHDAGPTIDLRMLVPTKAETLSWWAVEAGRELSPPYSVEAEPNKFQPPVTHLVDIRVLHREVQIERRQLALCDAKNQHGQLRHQVEAFLEWCSGVPGVYRSNGFAKGKSAQVAPALADLRTNHGFIVDVAPSEWNSLDRARKFHELHEANPEFLRWRKEVQWLRQLVKPLGVLIAVPSQPTGSTDLVQESPKTAATATISEDQGVTSTAQDMIDESSAQPFPVFIGTPLDSADANDRISWDPYREHPDQLNNFSFLVTGDSGAGKTQTIRVLIDAACRANLPTLIFDFKADYGAEPFTQPLGLEVVDVRRRGLPFNPLKPPPGGASGAQPAEHAYEVAGLLKRVMGLGDVQEGLVRGAINGAYQSRGIDPRDWVDPEAEDWPTFDAVVERLREEPKAANVVTRLAPLVELGLFPVTQAGPSFSELMARRVVLSLSELPTDELKSLLAEIIIIQVHGHALRGPQPRRLARMMVFDEAHRIAASKRLEALGREGRAFGIGLVIGTQYPGDITDEVAGSMATQLSLMNGQADHRRAVVRQVYGTTSSADAKHLNDALARLKPLQGLFANAHHRPTLLAVHPHYLR